MTAFVPAPGSPMMREWQEERRLTELAAREAARLRYVWLVVYPVRGGLAGIWLDEEDARRYAQAANGLVVRLKVVADYRDPED